MSGRFVQELSTEKFIKLEIETSDARSFCSALLRDTKGYCFPWRSVDAIGRLARLANPFDAVAVAVHLGWIEKVNVNCVRLTDTGRVLETAAPDVALSDEHQSI